MKLRGGKSFSVHVCCIGEHIVPVFLQRSTLSHQEKAAIPNPAGSFVGRCQMIINLNDVLDHFAFCVLSARPEGLRERIMRGFRMWLTQHISEAVQSHDLSSADEALLRISSGEELQIYYQPMREAVLRYPFERSVEDHIGNHYCLVQNEWNPFTHCYCRGWRDDLYLEIGEDFQTMCYHCYARSFDGRLLQDRRTFLSYAGNITWALVREGRIRRLHLEKRDCSLEEMCAMADCIGASLKRSIIDAPHSHFLQAARVAWNELIGLDRLNDDGWNVVWSPLGQAPSEEPEEEDQRANSDEEGESNFEGYGSEDSEETQPYPMPEESGDEHEETQDEEEFAGTV